MLVSTDILAARKTTISWREELKKKRQNYGVRGHVVVGGMSIRVFRWRGRRYPQTSGERMVGGVWERRAVGRRKVVVENPSTYGQSLILHQLLISASAHRQFADTLKNILRSPGSKEALLATLLMQEALARTNMCSHAGEILALPCAFGGSETLQLYTRATHTHTHTQTHKHALSPSLSLSNTCTHNTHKSPRIFCPAIFCCTQLSILKCVYSLFRVYLMVHVCFVFTYMLRLFD